MNKELFRKKWFVITFLIVIVLLITNPTNNNFREYLASNDEYWSRNTCGRQYNFLILSIYKNNDYRKQVYIGVLENFIKLDLDRKKIDNKEIKDSIRLADSLMVIDSLYKAKVEDSLRQNSLRQK